MSSSTDAFWIGRSPGSSATRVRSCGVSLGVSHLPAARRRDRRAWPSVGTDAAAQAGGWGAALVAGEHRADGGVPPGRYGPRRGAADHPEWFDPRVAAWYRWLLPRLVKRVARVITVSQFSKTRLMERLGVPADRIVAIPNGVSSRFHPRPPGGGRPGHRPVSPHGTVSPDGGEPGASKNFDIVARAWVEADQR